MVTLAHLNDLDRDQFVETIGSAFEHSPWIAERVWESRPFESSEALHAALVDVVRAASSNEQLALIAAHPDLAGRVAREGLLTPASSNEQAAAGLDRLTPDEIARFDRLNAAYRKRFGFPFVICAREHDKASIFAALERRSRNDRESEVKTALDEIARIARLRLESAVVE